MNPPLILASASPRRAQLLLQLGLRFEACAVDADETPRPGEDAGQLVARLSRRKAEAALARFPHALVLGADTAVEVDGLPLGKPRDPADAAAMLRRLSGRRHRVCTGVTVCDAKRAETRLSATEVSFRVLREAEIAAYVAGGEPADKAGAYAIQGRAAAFISCIAGSFSGVMGLPLFETAELLQSFGLRII